MSNFIRHNEVNMANEPPKYQQQLLERSSGIEKFPCLNENEHSSDTEITENYR